MAASSPVNQSWLNRGAGGFLFPSKLDQVSLNSAAIFKVADISAMEL